MRIRNIEDVQQNWDEVVSLLNQGEEVILRKSGKDFAKVTPYSVVSDSESTKTTPQGKGFVAALKQMDFGPDDLQRTEVST